MDIWAIGLTAIELATGSNPFSCLSPIKVYMSIHQSPLALFGDFSSELKSFVSECGKIDVEDRATVHQLSQHPFMQQANATSLLGSLLAK